MVARDFDISNSSDGVLEKLVEEARHGTRVILKKGNERIAEIIPFRISTRTAGLHKGLVTATSDFDAPLPDSFWGAGE